MTQRAQRLTAVLAVDDLKEPGTAGTWAHHERLVPARPFDVLQELAEIRPAHPVRVTRMRHQPIQPDMPNPRTHGLLTSDRELPFGDVG
jgi:hypothetical protein